MSSIDALPSLDECQWYHSMDLPGIGTVEGDWDLRGRFDEYTGRADLKEKTVLDFGAASGFLTFEAERRGAHVTSFDADSPHRFQLIPPNTPDSNHVYSNYFYRMRNSYKLAHALYKSKAKTLYGNIYEMGNVPLHDVAIAGQILVHLRDPFGALEQIARCAKETLIIAEGMIEDKKPVGYFCGTQAPFSWWQLSLPIYRSFLSGLGFAAVREGSSRYRCNDPGMRGDVRITTIVAKRKSS